ncbi:MAG: hypothetical protein U0736_01275 [Gemmataceae bacterium]
MPLREPLLNGQVGAGSDSVLTAVHRGRLAWVWGDTNRPSYPLGNFQVTAAVSDLPSKGGLAAGVGVDLRLLYRRHRLCPENGRHARRRADVDHGGARPCPTPLAGSGCTPPTSR